MSGARDLRLSLKVGNLAHTAAGRLLAARLADGSLARTAWNAYRRLPKRGLYRILEAVGS